MMRLALGWTIVHSLWEGAMVALMLAVALSVMRSSRVRYAAACVAMLGILAGFGLTLSRELQAAPATNTTGALRIPPAPPDALDRLRGVQTHFRGANVLPWLAPFWTAGVILFHLYSLASWIAVRRLRRRGVCCTSDIWQQRLTRQRERLRLSTPVTLLESSLAGVPVVIGYLRPVILVPVGMLTGMSGADRRKRSCCMNWRTSGGVTIWSTCCRPWSRAFSFITRRSGGSPA